MAKQCPFTIKDIEKAVEKLKQCCAKPPYLFQTMTPNGLKTFLANSVEEAAMKVKEMWVEKDA